MKRMMRDLRSGASVLTHGQSLWAMTAALILLAFASTRVGATTPSPPQFRLGDDARPLRYAVELVVVPEHDTFSGSVTIELKLARRISILWLHGSGLIADDVHLETGGAKIPTRVESGGNQYLGFAFERPVGPGHARLHVAYHGKTSDRDRSGLLRRRKDNDWYAATMLVPTSARRVFPCFDEPGFKVPWQVTLHVKREHLALANTPIVSEADEPNGMKCVRFAETKPLPSYVVAFAVGPFDTVDLGKVGRKGTPVRIVTPRGQTSEAAFAAQAIPVWLRMLEDYCGVPFPYEKLDHVAFPDYVFAGMENAGLITYAEAVLLTPPEREVLPSQWMCSIVSSHEMAHQWLGDLVTIAWWDDRWFKEAMAMVVSEKILHQWNPDRYNGLSETMIRTLPPIDGRPGSAGSLRQPVTTEADIMKTWASNGMNRGAGILMMFEAWLGTRPFQKSIQRFLRQYAGRNATSGDFVKVMSAEAWQNLSPALSTFLDQPGVPLVKVQLKDAERGRAIVALSQCPYHAVGSPGLPECMWRIPIQLRYQAEGREKRVSIMLNGPETEVVLRAAPDTVKWVLVNEASAGYYRVAYPVFMLQRLFCDGREHLSAMERLGLAEDLRASVTSGELPLGDTLALLPQLLTDSEPRVVVQTTMILDNARGLVPESLRPNYQRYVRTAVAPMLRNARWQASSGESENARQLRLALLVVMANHGEEPSLVQDARRHAVAWLADPNTVEPDTAQAVLRVAGRHCDRTLFEQFLDKAKRATEATDRRLVLTAVGSCRDPVLLNSALTALVARQFQPDDAYVLLEEACSQVENRELVYEFVKQHFDAVMAALPNYMRSWSLTMIVQDFSDPEHLADVERFLKDKDPELTGGPQGVAQILENIDMACTFRKVHQKSVEDFLEGR